MYPKRPFSYFLQVVVILFFFHPTQSLYGEGQMTVFPSSAMVGSFQNIRFEFKVDISGLDSGGGIRLEIPVGNLETEPYFWDRPQIELPQTRGYVQVSTTGKAKIQIRLYGRRGGIIECSLIEGSLTSNDKIFIDYNGIVQSLDWNLSIRTEWRKTADESWQFIDNFPVMSFLPGKAVTLTAITPADLQKGETFDLAIVLLDKFGNRASRYQGEISITSTDPLMKVPEPYKFMMSDSGTHIFRNLKYITPGFQQMAINDGQLKSHSNYSDVSNSAKPFKRFFGDTHFHTGSGTGNLNTNGRGGDHRGNFTTAKQAYRYVRDVMRLDFASASEHDVPELNEKVWANSQAIANSFYKPGDFTTLFAYEWTSPVGHHVVSYKDSGNAVFSRHQHNSLEVLWEKLDQQNAPALTIPHVTWPTPDHQIWEHINNQYRKVGEIYSLWNNRWLLQPGDDPQRFEIDENGDWSYQYAWARGHKIGVIGSSDNHTGHPGANNYTVYTQHTGGLAVVLAKGNNREDIWDAYQHRRTYATTGTRILLDFTSDDHFMGDEYSTNTAPELQVRVAGTNTLKSVEIIKHDNHGYQTIYSANPDSETESFNFIDDEFSEDSFYYVRVTQVDEYWRSPWANTTSEMAWSSPIWVNFSK